MRRTTLTIPDELYWAGEKARIRSGQTRSQFYTAAVNLFIAKHGGELDDDPNLDPVADTAEGSPVD